MKLKLVIWALLAVSALIFFANVSYRIGFKDGQRETTNSKP